MPPHVSRFTFQVPDLLLAIYRELHTTYGPQHWWPTRGGGAWEIMVGAVLTQHTTWRNVDRALGNLRSGLGPEGLSRPEVILEASPETLGELVRPAGFHTAKPRKLQSLARFMVEAGGIEALAASGESTEGLRQELLGIWGIGPETADAILLYALGRPVFVADAYALRLASRWGLLAPGSSYETVQALFMDNLPHDAQLFNEYHALIVAHAKELCRPRPRCEVCPLNREIPLDRDKPPSRTWRCPKLHTPYSAPAPEAAAPR
jgi:endonuclease III related protein